MKLITLTIGFALAAHAAAETNVQGTWRLNKQACASGAPVKGWGPEVIGNLEALVEIDAREMHVTYNLAFKYDENFAAEQKQKFKVAHDAIEQLPAGPVRDESLAQFASVETLVNEYSKGVSCTSRQTAPYSIDGDVVRMGKTTVHTSDCPGDDAKDNEDDGQENRVTIVGDQMTITTPEDDSDGTCEKGDQQITIWSKIPLEQAAPVTTEAPAPSLEAEVPSA